MTAKRSARPISRRVNPASPAAKAEADARDARIEGWAAGAGLYKGKRPLGTATGTDGLPISWTQPKQPAPKLTSPGPSPSRGGPNRAAPPKPPLGTKRSGASAARRTGVPAQVRAARSAQ
jgi:hypothetical protein